MRQDRREQRELVERCDSDRDVDDATRGVRLSEVEAAADPRDEIELEDADETPVESSNDDEQPPSCE